MSAFADIPFYGFDKFTRQTGLEPVTLRLTAECSTIELLANHLLPAVFRLHKYYSTFSYKFVNTFFKQIMKITAIYEIIVKLLLRKYYEKKEQQKHKFKLIRRR